MLGWLAGYPTRNRPQPPIWIIRSAMSDPSLLERIALWPWAEAATILFGFAWGAMLGSFINVVVYRLPRGESVVAERSRCPRCQAAIRPTDNVPVLGWLWLGGRCRDCGGAIATFYPLVEGFCGLVVAILATADLVAGGRWLPRLADRWPSGIDRLLRGDWQLLVAFALHAGVVLLIICWSLLDGELAAAGDGETPGGDRSSTAPIRGLLVALAIALVTVAAVPAVGPPGLLPSGIDWPMGKPRLSALAAALTGLAAGWLSGVLSATIGWWRLAAIRFGLPLLGSVLGWQLVTVATIVTIAIACASRPWCGKPWLPGLVLAAVATLGLAFSGPLLGIFAHVLGFWPGP